MKVIRILTGIVLAIVITSMNGVAGYGYTFGGVFESGIGMWGAKEGEDSRIVVEITEDGTKKIRPKDGLSALSLIASTKIGAFGIFLHIFIWFQFAAGILLLFKNSAGAVLFAFLIFVAVGSLFAEITGAILTSSFGTTNALGSVVAVTLGIVSFSMYRQNSRGVARDAP
jgi:hypothetical protein